MENIEFERGNIRPTECISEGWNLIKDDYWLFLGMTLLAMIILGCTPCVNIFLIGPTMVGLNYCFLRKMRNEPLEFGMMFKGFEKFVPAMVVGLIQSIPAILYQIFSFSFQIVDVINQTSKSREFFVNETDIFAGGLGVAIILGVIVIYIFFLIWTILFFFVYPLLAEHDLEIMETIKLSFKAAWSNFGMIFVLMILGGLLAMVGVLALCIGVLFVMPIVFAANTVAYRQVFPDTNFNNQMINVPPPPTVYGNQF